MNETAEPKPRVRRLYQWEIEEVRPVFGERFKYEQVRIHEYNPWPNRVDNLGRRLKGSPPRQGDNAITLGNHCIFPIGLPELPVTSQDPDHYKSCWLIHELTHAWQYQQQGWIYLVKALTAQFKYKARAYEYGGAPELRRLRAEGWTIYRFNLEQQGDITRDYYARLRSGDDVSDWLPYIDDICRIA